MDNLKALSDMPIGFPGLFGGLTFDPDPIAIHLGHGVYWYGIILALGLLAGLYLCMKQARRFGLSEDNVMDMVLWAIPCCIVGSRIYYVIFYLDLYRTADGSLDWGRIVAIWDGGIAMYGTVIVGLLVAFIYCRRKKLSFFAMTDLCVMGLFLGQCIGRWGNFVNREAFGTTTELPWRMQLWISQTRIIEVHPTFLYESLWNLAGLLMALFVISRARRFDGENTCFYFLWYGLGRSWIEGLRTDSLYLFDWTFMGEPIRVSQALSIVMFLVAAAMLFYNIKLHPHSPDELYVNRVAASAAEAAAEGVSPGDGVSPAEGVFAAEGVSPGEGVSSAEGISPGEDGEPAEKKAPEQEEDPENKKDQA